MEIGDCYIAQKVDPNKDCQYVLMRILKISKQITTEEISISSEQEDYIDISIHRRSPRKVSVLNTFPANRYSEIRTAIIQLNDKCKELIENSVIEATGHNTREGDCYYQDGYIEYVINFVNCFRPSWNVDTFRFDSKGYDKGHYRFGVEIDHFEKDPKSWKLIDASIYKEVSNAYCQLAREIRETISSFIINQN